MRRLAILSLVLFTANATAADDKPIKLLFLGDNGHHKPMERFRQLQPALAKRGIDITYTDKVEALSAKTLAPYDGLIIYANHTKWSPENETALLEYVESGRGFIPLHCASYCFIDSKKYVDLVGAQFQRHNTGTFRTTIAEPNHDLMKGYKGFESWDETYVHTKHNEKDRTVLEYRMEGTKNEPWTWVRTQGKGRVFYTAWGHDERTFGNPGFHNLVERGIRWAVGKDPSVVPAFGFNDKPEMTPKRKDVKPFEYVEANIPFYAPREGGARPKLMQKPVDVEESMKHFVTPVDFEVKPFVTEDKLGGKPIAMTWDEQGRLWVSITQDYPNERQPEGQGRDRIVVCEDGDGNGVCDKVTIFADKLSIPTSLLRYAGGIIVHQAPHTLFLKDTDGDGKADLRQVLFTGWGTGDTHAGPSNLRYGFDNWIYGMVGYSAFNGEVAGETLNFRQGLYRFKLERDGTDNHKLKTTKLEFLRSTSNNSWGVGFTEEGLLFGSTANGCSNVFMPIPNRYYEGIRGLTPGVLPNIAADNHIEPITEKVRQVDWHHGFTAAAGHEIYTARTYPREYWNRVAFVSEPTGHLTAAMVLQPDGSTFKAKYGWNLIASDDEWSAPIDAQVGPDGHMWVIDWYNFIVQHNPTPPGFQNGKGNAYETPLRDKKHGRIYRVVYTKASPQRQQGFTLSDAKPEDLVAALKHPTMTWRLHAQRLLVERSKTDISDALVKLVEDKQVDAIGLNAGALHALWTLEGLGEFTHGRRSLEEHKRVGELIGRLSEAALVKNPSAAVRRAGAQVLWDTRDNIAVGRMHGLALDDVDPQVRLAALLAIAERGKHHNSVNDFDVVARMLQRDDLLADPNLRDAVTMAAVSHGPFVSRVLSNQTKLSASALRVVETAMASGARAKKLGYFFVDEKLLQLMATADMTTTAAIVAGFSAGWPSDYSLKLSSAHEEAIAKLLTRLPAASRGQLLKLAQVWGVKGITEQLKEIAAAMLKTALDEKTKEEQRVEAIQQVVGFNGDDNEVVTKLLSIVSARSSPVLLNGVFEALSSSQAKDLGTAVVAKLPSLSPAGRTAALRLLLSRPTSTRALLDAFEKGTLAIGELSLDQKQALASHSDAAIAKRAKALLAKGGGLPDADRQKVIDEYISVTKEKGNVEAGKLVFKNQCAKCHMHGTEGAKIGPDLTGVAVHSKEHMLIDILDPSRSVEGNYRVWKVTTADGKSFNGLLAAETKTSIEIIDAEAKKHVIQREDIENLQASSKSLMPEGFEKQIKDKKELIDLLEFFAQKGKYLPIPLDKAATIVSTKGMFFDESSTIERMIFPDWSPKTYKSVPFQLVDPQGDKVRNVILLNGPQGTKAPTMPKSVKVPCNTAAKAIHLLSGASGWGYQGGAARETVSMIVRLHYEDGKTEDHELKDGIHFADYIRKIDVPGSEFAFALRGQQIRYLAVTPKRADLIKEIEFVKGPDRTAPIVMAVTVETR